MPGLFKSDIGQYGTNHSGEDFQPMTAFNHIVWLVRMS